MSRVFCPFACTIAGLLLLFALASPSSAQTPANAAPLGRGLSTAPQGYTLPPGYISPTPAIQPSASMPNYMSATPYSLSTPTGYGPYPGYYGYTPPFGAALQGYASLTQATGQYWQSIQQARITREQSRQMALDTQRKQIEFEMWYEGIRPTAPKMIAKERAASLDWARQDPPKSEIWSGSTLNVLLKSILNSSQPTSGPTIPLDQSTVQGLNLTDKTTRGNLSLAKDEGRIAWTEALQEEDFDQVRDRFGQNFDKAMKEVSAGQQPPIPIVRDLRKDLKALDDKLDDKARDLSPDRYIESRRLLNQLKNTVKGLSDSRVCKSCMASWKKNVRTVADIVGYCAKNGLEFGPAVAPGDQPCYTAFYYSLRNYERGIWQNGSR
jgi:hypothetical protein